MSEIRNLSRRGLLGQMFSAGAFVLAARVVPDSALAAVSKTGAKKSVAGAADWHPNLWLTLSPDGTLTIPRPPLRDGHGSPQFTSGCGRGRDGCRHEPGPH